MDLPPHTHPHPHSQSTNQLYPRPRPHAQQSEGWDSLDPWVGTTLDETYDDRDLETLLRGLSHDRFNKRVGPSCLVSMQVGG